MTQLAPELIHLIIKLSLEDLTLLPTLTSPSYSGFLNLLTRVSFLFSEIARIELFKKIHVVKEIKGNLLILELKRLGWENKVESLDVGIDQFEKEGWCEDLIRILPNLKRLNRQNLQTSEVWTIAPIKPDLEFLGRLNQLTTLTFQNLYNFHLPFTLLNSLTNLNLINTHLPCVQNLFKSSPIKNLSILNNFLPIPHKSLQILLTSLPTIIEFSFFIPRHQVGINHLRETICYLLPDLLILRTTPSFLFSSAGTGLNINLPSKLIKLEILKERYFGDPAGKVVGITGGGGGGGGELKETKVLTLLDDMEDLKELALEKDWSSSNVEVVCVERDVGLVVR